MEIKNILDIGCGAGRTTFALAKLFPNAKIKAIDISEELLKNLQNTDNITFELINILEYNTQEKFDFILFSFNGLTNILPQKDVIKFFIKIKELLRDEKSRFVFTIHDIFSSQEYKDFW
ncbi:trans-aconitate 2-methyltransferase, partial [Metamycoplasma alkalescens]